MTEITHNIHDPASLPRKYTLLIGLGMLYMSIMLLNATMTNRYIGSENLFVLGGTLTSPILFILCDIITELFNYKIAKNIIISGFISQMLFVLICQLIVISPTPHFSSLDSNQYYNIFGPSLLNITLSGCFAYFIAMFFNSYILSRWKILLKGKYFWLRSLGSSSIAEALYSCIAILLMEIKAIPLHDVFHIMMISFLIKLSYSLIFSFPANFIIFKLRQLFQICLDDFPETLTPKNILKTV